MAHVGPNRANFARKRTLQGALVAATIAVWACTTGTQDGGAGGDGDGGSPLRHDLLRSVADNALAPSFAQFQAAAVELESATARYAEAMQAGEDSSGVLSEAQDAWRNAMDAWQIVELMQLGPAGSSAVAIGGADLRDEIYSWPTVNTCRVDQELVLGEYGADDFVATRLVNVYGLDTIEYLLFQGGTENSCPPQLPINADGEWDAMGEGGVVTGRAQYAAHMAASVAATASSLAQDWAVESGTFNEGLANPGEGDSPYPSVDDAMDELMRAMFYLDLSVKDAKLAVPAGLLDCGSPACPEDLESTWAQVSREAVAANLEGFRRMYYGGIDAETSIGFDDVLIDMGEDNLAVEMDAAIEGAFNAMDGMEGSFRDALLADEAALDPVHAAVKRITDLLKGDFATVLMLEIPSEGAGDAD